MNRNIMILAIGCGLALSGCGAIKKQASTAREAPDEFKVIKRAPLTQPPNYVLRPPRPGAPRPQEKTTAAQAADVVFGNPSSQIAEAPAAPTSGEEALLSRAGGSNLDPAIRKRIDEETLSGDYTTKKPVAQRLLGLDGNDADNASIVNAKEEAQRLKDNAESGKPVTEGETPSLER